MTNTQAAFSQIVRKVISPVVGLVVVLLFGLLVALWSVADYQTATAQMEQANLVKGAVAIRGDAMRATALGYAAWDEAFDNLVTKLDTDWADDNIGFRSYRQLGFDMAFVLGPDGEATYSSVRARRDKRPFKTILSQGIDTLVRQASAWGSNTATSGLVLAEGRPALATVMPIRRTVSGLTDGPTPYQMVMVDILDQNLLAEIGRVYLLPNLRLDPPASESRISVPATSADGVVIANFAWDGERPGDSLLKVALPVWLAIAVAFTLLIGLGMRQARAAALLVAHSEERSRHDALTGLPNRVLLFERLDAALRALGEPGAKGFAVAYLDLDGFKRVNDELGHDAGDRVLRVVAERLRKVVDPRDVVARLGGDEFVLILHEPADREALHDLAARLIAATEEPVALDGGLEARVSATVGLTLAPEDGTDPLELLRYADQALYAGKRTGKHRSVFYDAVIPAQADAGSPPPMRSAVG